MDETKIYRAIYEDNSSMVFECAKREARSAARYYGNGLKVKKIKAIKLSQTHYKDQDS